MQIEFLSQSSKTLTVPSRNDDSISKEEEYALFTNYRDNGCQASRDKVINSHQNLVCYLANRQTGYKLDVDDIIQEGNIGLLKAFDKFDLTKGFRFTTFATHYVRSEMQEYIIKNVNILKTVTTKPQRKLFFGLSRALKKHEGLSLREKIKRISCELDVSVDDVSEAILKLNAHQSHYNTIESHDIDDGGIRGLVLSCDSTNNEDLVFSQQIKSMLNGAVNELPNERMKDIFFKRIIADEKANLSELSDVYNVSMQRVSQLEKEVIDKLSSYMMDNLSGQRETETVH